MGRFALQRTVGHSGTVFFQVVDLAEEVDFPAFKEGASVFVADLLVEQVAAHVLRILVHRFGTHACYEVDVELQRGGGVGRERAEQRDDVRQSVACAPGDVRALVAVLCRDGLCVAAADVEQGQRTLACRACTGLAREFGVDIVGIVDADAAGASATECARHLGKALGAQLLGNLLELGEAVDGMHVDGGCLIFFSFCHSLSCF